MKINKKGVHTHITIILIVSLVMSMFFVTILGALFKKDNQECQSVSYEILNKKKQDNLLILDVRNLNTTSKLDLRLIGKGEKKETLIAGETKQLKIIVDGSLEIIPMLITRTEQIECNGKKIEINTNMLIKS